MHRPVTQMIDIDLIFRILVFPGFTFILILTLFRDWVERKFEARIQNRVGPIVAGPAGLFQPLADFIKLFTKEDIEPPNCGTIGVGISAGDVK
jgi:NADH-quinone oxidoreductase subunit H